MRLQDSSGNELAGVRWNGSSLWYAYHGTTFVSLSTLQGAYNAATTYYCWMRYKKGTGSNGEIDFYASTTQTRPATPSVITTGTSTADAARIYFRYGNTRIVVDKIRVSASSIGSSPT